MTMPGLFEYSVGLLIVCIIVWANTTKAIAYYQQCGLRPNCCSVRQQVFDVLTYSYSLGTRGAHRSHTRAVARGIHRIHRVHMGEGLWREGFVGLQGCGFGSGRALT
jgi:hypothetical protein